MSEFIDRETLLRDVLSEGAGSGYREALLGETLRLVRRRRRFRQARRGASLLVICAGLTLLIWHDRTHLAPVRSLAKAGYVVVSTEPLTEANIVRSSPSSVARIVTSEPPSNTVTTIDATPPVREVQDDELLALAAPRSVVLVRIGPHDAELVFTEGERN